MELLPVMNVLLLAGAVELALRSLNVKWLRLANAAIAVGAVAWAALAPVGTAWIFVANAFPFLLLGSAFVLAARREKGVLPSEFVAPLTTPPSTFGLMSWPLFLLNCVLVASAAWLFNQWLPLLTERVPLHWGITGQVDRWGSPLALWTFGAVMLLNILVGIGSAAAFAHERWALPVEGSERAFSLEGQRRVWLTRAVEVTLLFVNVGLAILWLSSARGIAFGWLALPCIALGLVACGWICLGPVRHLERELHQLGAARGFGTLAEGWLWGGLIYYAPHDPAILVPKRLGIGLTLNFARPIAWVLLALPIVGAMVVSVVSK